MIRLPPDAPRPDTLFPESTLFRSAVVNRLARQDVVAHRAILLGKRRALEPVDLRLERALLQPGAFIFLADRLLDPRRDRLDLPVDLVDLRLHLLHRRICLELFGEVLAQSRGRLRALVETLPMCLVG